jgi:hypothetical protein
MNRGRNFRDKGARKNFFQPRFGEQVVAWLKEVLLPAYVHRNGNENPALENFLFTFSKLAPEKIEEDELVGEAFDDPSKTGAVLFVVLMSWWEFSIHRRQLNFLQDPEAMLYQATLVSLVRCFRAVTVWRRGCRHNMEIVMELAVKDKAPSKGVSRSRDDDAYREAEEEEEDELNSSQYRGSSVPRPSGRPLKVPRVHVPSRLGMTSTTTSGAGSPSLPPSRSPTESLSCSTKEEDPETSTAALLGGRHITSLQPPPHCHGAAVARRPGSNPPRATQPELRERASRPRPRPIVKGKGPIKTLDPLLSPGTPDPPPSTSHVGSKHIASTNRITRAQAKDSATASNRADSNLTATAPTSKRRTRAQADDEPSEEHAEEPTSLRLQKDYSSASEGPEPAPSSLQRPGYIKTRGPLALPTLRTSELFGPPKPKRKRQKTGTAESADALES